MAPLLLEAIPVAIAAAPHMPIPNRTGIGIAKSDVFGNARDEADVAVDARDGVDAGVGVGADGGVGCGAGSSFSHGISPGYSGTSILVARKKR